MGNRVLLLEDEPLILMMLCDWMRDLAYEPHPANTIKAALSDLRSKRPDFALIDFYISGQPSYPVLDQLTALKVPTLLATAAQPDEIEVAYRHIPKISKPFKFEAVEAVLKTMATDTSGTFGLQQP